MNYGLYLSASGVLTNSYRQDVYANNLANVETAGFKPYIPTISQRPPESIEDPQQFGLSQKLLDRLGGGVLTGPERLNFMTGPLRHTGRELDAALTRPDQFFAVQHTDPQTGRTSLRLTRDGRFSRNEDGNLVTQTGQRVLDRENQPITIPDGVLPSINGSGEIIDQDGNVVAGIQVTRVYGPEDKLRAYGQNLFGFKRGDDRELIDNPVIEAGFTEDSSVNPIHTLMKLIAATKSTTGNAQMIKYQDQLMDRAINTLGRVA